MTGAKTIVGGVSLPRRNVVEPVGFSENGAASSLTQCCHRDPFVILTPTRSNMESKELPTGLASSGGMPIWTRATTC